MNPKKIVGIAGVVAVVLIMLAIFWILSGGNWRYPVVALIGILVFAWQSWRDYQKAGMVECPDISDDDDDRDPEEEGEQE